MRPGIHPRLVLGHERIEPAKAQKHIERAHEECQHLGRNHFDNVPVKVQVAILGHIDIDLFPRVDGNE